MNNDRERSCGTKERIEAKGVPPIGSALSEVFEVMGTPRAWFPRFSSDAGPCIAAWKNAGAWFDGDMTLLHLRIERDYPIEVEGLAIFKESYMRCASVFEERHPDAIVSSFCCTVPCLGMKLFSSAGRLRWRKTKCAYFYPSDSLAIRAEKVRLIARRALEPYPDRGKRLWWHFKNLPWSLAHPLRSDLWRVEHLLNEQNWLCAINAFLIAVKSRGIVLPESDLSFVLSLAEEVGVDKDLYT